MARTQNPIEQYGMARYDVANKKPRGQDGVFSRRDGNQARDEAQAAARETQSPTFSELQSQGRPRPAQPQIMPYGMGDVNAVGTGAPAIPSGTQPIREGMGSPGASPQANADPRWSAIEANLAAMFGAQRQRLDTDLARRGMWASTGELGAGAALGDLEGQQSRALASARADYEMQKDERYDRLMQMLLPLIMGG